MKMIHLYLIAYTVSLACFIYGFITKNSELVMGFGFLTIINQLNALCLMAIVEKHEINPIIED